MKQLLLPFPELDNLQTDGGTPVSRAQEIQDKINELNEQRSTLLREIVQLMNERDAILGLTDD